MRIDGVIFIKFDVDVRGGVVLSISYVIGVFIFFVGVG